jgi:hypothetical protein
MFLSTRRAMGARELGRGAQGFGMGLRRAVFTTREEAVVARDNARR